MDKLNLDKIIKRHKAQPVGHGYIDIIVSRDTYKDFISDIVSNDYKIDSISWWEWCPDNKKCQYGLGGPESIFYEGWFSEIPINVDDLKLPTYLNHKRKINAILSLIETKVISLAEKQLTFYNNQWLTPAIWLDVPDEWRNEYTT